MAINTQPGATFEASTPPIASGLVGTLGTRIMDGQGATVTARSTAGIIETPDGSGIYVATLTAPATGGQYLLVWDTGGDPVVYGSEDLTVTTAFALPVGTPGFPDVGAFRDEYSQALERVSAGRRARITVQFLNTDEEPVAPDDAPLVTVIDDAGFELLSDVATTVDADDDTRYTALVAADAIPSPTILAAIWTADVDGELERVVTTVEVCAAHLFTLAQLRTLLADVRTLEQRTDREFTTQELRVARLEAERDLEAACHQAFTTRYERETVRIDRFARARTRWPHVTKLRTAAIDDDDLDTDAVTIGPSTGLAYTSAWTVDAVLTVAYEHGQPVAGAGQAALVLAKERLLRGPISDRATQQVAQGELGGTIRLLTPGQRGVITGIPVVDEFISRNTWTSVRLA